MSDLPPSPTQASLGTVRTGVIRNDIQENIQPDANGVIAPFSFSPPGGQSGWERVRITNYSPYVFQVIGIPGGGQGDPPQILAPFQQNVWNYKASRGTITLRAAQDNSPLSVPPLRFAYALGPGAGSLVPWFVTVEWTDTPDLFFGYYPTPLTGIAIDVEAISALPPTSIAVGTDPEGIAFNSNGTRAYVSNFGDNTVTVLNMIDLTVVATVALTHHGPRGLAVRDVGGAGAVYVCCATDGFVDIIDTGSNLVVGSINCPGAYDVCLDVGLMKKWVTGGTVANSVYVIDNTETVTATIPVGARPLGIAIDHSNQRVYVANTIDATVDVIDANLDVVVGVPIVVGTAPNDVASDDTVGKVYVCNGTDGTVSVIDVTTALVVATVAVGLDPVSASANPLTGFVYVANNGSNSVSVIDTASDTVTDTLNPGVGPLALGADYFINNRVWVTLTAGVVVVLQGE